MRQCLGEFNQKNRGMILLWVKIFGTLHAEQLGAAEKTIKIHRGQVMRKMEVESVAELVRVAQIAGVSPVPRS